MGGECGDDADAEEEIDLINLKFKATYQEITEFTEYN